MTYPIEEEVLDDLIWWVKYNVSEGQVVYTLCDLRDGLEDESARKYFQKVIDEMAERIKYCPQCGNELAPIMYKEKHDELDGDYYEVGTDGYMCEICNEKYDY